MPLPYRMQRTMMSEPKQPPAGVETAPQGRVVPLPEAAARLNKDPRTVIRAIRAGTLRGGAEPRPQRLRWYVYEDQLPPQHRDSPGESVDDLRAQLVTQTEVNRLLMAAQQELLAGDEDARRAADRYRALAQELLAADDDARRAGDRYRAAAQHYLDALSQYVTPGHPGELVDG